MQRNLEKYQMKVFVKKTTSIKKFQNKTMVAIWLYDIEPLNPSWCYFVCYTFFIF